MGRFALLVLFAAAIAAVVFALRPTTPSADRPPAVAAGQQPARPEAPAEADPTRPAEPPTETGAAPIAPAPPAAPVAAATPPPAADEAPTAAPSPPVAPSWAAPPEAPKGPPLGRMGAAPMPEVPVAVVKDHIRRYYGNLPRNGRMPARILAEELLPLDVIRGLNIPPDSRVIELGHHPTTTLTGFEEALALPEDQLGLLGITVKTADGREYRDYIHTIPQQ